MRRTPLLLFLVSATLIVDAQSFFAVRRNRNLMINFGSGTANYFGEMVNPKQFGIVKPNLAVGAEIYLSPRISVSTELTWFQLSGDDANANDDRSERNLSFRSNNFEIAAVGAVNLIPNGLRYYQRPRINFHAFAGVAILYFDPRAVAPTMDHNGNPLPEAGEWVALAPLETEGVKYATVQPVIPFGFGVRIMINPFLNVLIEGGYRWTFTDYLDDVSSTRYPDPATLKSDLSRAMSDRRREIGTFPNDYLVGKRGNPENNDGYFLTNVTIQYYLPSEIFGGGNRKLYKQKRKSIYHRKR